MKNVEAVNSQFLTYLNSKSNHVVYGQNVNAGSRIGGIARNIGALETIEVINSTNSENTLAGFGFGLLLADISSCYVLKQHDFMLLGMDHWRNTWNAIRTREFRANYLILAPVVDSGYEGPQANLNNLSEFSSIFDCPVYLINTTTSIEKVFSKVDSSPLSIIGLSQKTLKSEIDTHEDFAPQDNSYSVFIPQHTEIRSSLNKDFIVCLGFTWNNVSKTIREFTFSRKKIFIVPHMIGNTNYLSYLQSNLLERDRIVLLDDSYSSLGEIHIHKQELETKLQNDIKVVKLDFSEQKTRPHPQDFEEIKNYLKE
jgi:hypothetical protein